MEAYNVTSIKIPLDRVGVVIGKNGETKKMIEDRMNVKLEIDSNDGMIKIFYKEGDLNFLKARDFIYAIGRGFSPTRAIRILDDDMVMYDTINLSHLSKKNIMRIKGRIIGKNGSMRSYIENVTGAMISVYGSTILIIGYPQEINTAKKAISMLIEGMPHGVVYKFLDNEKIRLRKINIEQ
ncbi:MAG: RNA-processing protein [Candidatus Methanoliparum thermophilum]|uniref:RNA-processing protein n=1 Tax=Methanoliparum thermophilum TaxID=2491083 RepID=A0A520KS39_METT2|nr:KH domain-containing protein [Candidatus Methanoliparum sp. LAM-1]RZN64314.1 MAG: RNA-processing protein [Candidatus Methanoliparum thermophilum]BDC35573.1 RNA-processing protein [Candidatus Methanoliparum sp. LAM-1]